MAHDTGPGGIWIADSGDVIFLLEPGRYPMAYFRQTDVSQDGSRGYGGKWLDYYL
jgi:hypothetical protein